MFFSFQAALTDAFSTIDSARLVPEAFKSIVPKEKFAFRLRSVLRLPILGAFSFLAHTFGSCCLCVCSFQLSSKMHSIVFNIILPQFEITLILKAQSDKTPVINLLVFK